MTNQPAAEDLESFTPVIDNNFIYGIENIITTITPYLICDHHFSTEIYRHNPWWVGFNIHDFFKNKQSDLYNPTDSNFLDKINDGDIIQVQCSLFDQFTKDVLPKISKKIILFTSQVSLPGQIERNTLTDECINNENILLWISTNPIYENHQKYMAFPYGIYHRTVGRYVKFLKENDLVIRNPKLKDTNVYIPNILVHDHLPKDHIRRRPFFKKSPERKIFEEYLSDILRSRFTISLGGDRDDTYRHYECIGLNSIPVSNIKYPEIFEDNMISCCEKGLFKIANSEIAQEYKEPNRDLITIDYWRKKIKERIDNL